MDPKFQAMIARRRAGISNNTPFEVWTQCVFVCKVPRRVYSDPVDNFCMLFFLVPCGRLQRRMLNKIGILEKAPVQAEVPAASAELYQVRQILVKHSMDQIQTLHKFMRYVFKL